MMIYPPIDKLVEKVDCKYALVCLVAKRTKFVLDKKAEIFENTNERPVSYAAREIFEDKVDFIYED